MTQVELIETPNGWEITTPNATIIRCIIDQAFSIEVYFDNQSLTLGIENEFIISEEDKIHNLDIEKKDGLIPGLHLIGKKVNKITMTHTGTIKVFMESAYILVKPDENYEAWNMYDNKPNGMLIVCIPGGDIGIWDVKTD